MPTHQIKSAQDLLAIHWDGQIPVPVIDLIQQLGIELVITDDRDQLKCCGQIDRINDQWRITNQVSQSSAQRWSLADQLGHCVLNHLATNQLPHYETPTSFRLTTLNQQEREANQFAHQLLIPENVLNYAISKRRITALESLVDLFGVSEVAMQTRLRDLGIVN